MEGKSAGRKPKDQILYTLYDADEQVIATGTAGQIAAGLRIQLNTFYQITHRIKQGTRKKNVVFIERYRWNQDPDDENSEPVSWDLYDPRGGELNEQHFNQTDRSDCNPNGKRTETDPRKRNNRDRGRTMADALRELGVFTYQ